MRMGQREGMSAEHRCWGCGHVWMDKPMSGGCPKCRCLYSTWLNMMDFGVSRELLDGILESEKAYEGH